MELKGVVKERLQSLQTKRAVVKNYFLNSRIISSRSASFPSMSNSRDAPQIEGQSPGEGWEALMLNG
jgi:hypothetical protein